MYIHREFPQKSWSVSRLESFYTCKRQYYYSTFGHWNGWERDADPRTKQIYRLKKLQNAYTLSGQLLHEQIKFILENSLKSPQNMLLAIRTKLNEAVKQSKDQRQLWETWPNRVAMLHEYYYGEGISKKLGNEITARMKLCLENFLESSIYKSFLNQEIKIIENDQADFNHFSFKGYKSYCILDLFYQKGDRYFIVDWKSGKPAQAENGRQMVVYALYVLSQYPQISLSSITGVNKYLLTGDTKEYAFSSEDILQCREFIEESIAEMDSYLVDSALNKPKPELEFKTKTGWYCKSCNFIELCPEGQAMSQCACSESPNTD